MFTSSQIIPATKLLKEFREISRELEQSPQALLITQKSKDPLVLVSAYIYEDLLLKHINQQELQD